jgi:molybdate transport system substrate-binding protein
VQRLAVAVVSAVLACAACSSSGGGGPSGGKLSGSIKVDAAASLTEAFTAIIQQFERAHPGTTVTLNFDASSTLETQINQGDKVDVFASAATSNMAGVKSAVHPTNFATNTAEIATPPDNPAHITTVQDLAKPGVKVALCAPAVPCGVVAAQVFKNAGITVHASASEPDVKSTLAIVQQGEADAGVVYVTDVRSAGSAVHAVVIPDSLNASTEYPIAALTNAPNPALAKAFVKYVLSAAGRKVLTADGFKNP